MLGTPPKGLKPAVWTDEADRRGRPMVCSPRAARWFRWRDPHLWVVEGPDSKDAIGLLIDLLQIAEYELGDWLLVIAAGILALALIGAGVGIGYAIWA